MVAMLRKSGFPVEEEATAWTKNENGAMPQQWNGYDCGVFMLTYMKRKVRGQAKIATLQH